MSEPTQTIQEPLLRTKLHRPVVPGDFLCRPRLHDLMNLGLDSPLTLVSAPAGYGKSLLVSHWAASQSVPCAWLSLDASDSAVELFVDYLLAAVETVVPGACPQTRRLARAPEPPPTAVLASALINELDALTAPLVLVLDDYHRIRGDSEVHALMRLLLAHPPRLLHLVIVARRDPPLGLTRLLAQAGGTEVRLTDLRFTDAETQTLLQALLAFTASDDALANLQKEIEGWAVGLRLVSLALRHTADPDGFLRQLHGGIALTQTYLLHEVIAIQPPALRRCLLRASLLERFCAGVCDTMRQADIGTETGPDGEPAAVELSGAEFIQTLRDGNLFTIALDDRGEWFRYHHLFGDLLRAEFEKSLAPAAIAELHQRASDWFEQQGLIDEAIRHALKAGDSIRAAEIVERHRERILDSDQWYILEKWLGQLPEALVQQRVELLLARVWIHFLHFRLEAVPQILDQIESLLGPDTSQQTGRDALRGEVAFMRGYIAMFLGDSAGSLRYLEQALKQLPASFEEARAQGEIICALSTQMIGRKEQALQALDRLLATYRSPNDLRKTRLLVTYVFIHLIAGDLDAADQTNQRLKQVADSARYAYAVAWCDSLQGNIHLHRNELDAAVAFLERSVAQRYVHHKRAALDAFAGLIYAYQALGRPDDAEATLRLLRDYVAGLDDPRFWALVDAVETRLAIMQQRPDPAVGWVRSNQPPAKEAMLWWLEIPSLTRCRALIADGSSTSLAAAQTQLREHAALNQAHHNPGQRIGILALQALAHEQQGESEDALAALEQALTLAQPGRWVWPFVELGPAMAALLRRLGSGRKDQSYIDALLAAFPQPCLPAKPSASVDDVLGTGITEQLTIREEQILELLAERLRDKEIADRLDISPGTVNSHLKSLYRKLGVGSRREAVAKAATRSL